MSDDILSRVNAIDTDILFDVVRQDQRNPSFEITEWSVRRLSDKGMSNPDGLWLFSGHGWEGDVDRSWSVVLKIFERPEQEKSQDHPRYWKREVLLAQSGLLERLPGPVRAPRFYRTDEYPDGAWLWMEQITDQQPGPWTLKEHSFAACQFGEWNGACLAAMPLFEKPWLARQHYLSWLTLVDMERDWQFPLNQTHVSGELRRRHEQLWADREMFYKVMEALPQAFSHFDSQRRNLFICNDRTGSNHVVAVDWELCGLGPLGSELNGIVADNAIMGEWEPADLPELDQIAFPRYIQGLQHAGWTGDIDLVRLGYVTWRAIYYGLIFPAWTAWWCADEHESFALQMYGLNREELFWKLLPLLEFCLDGSDEARRLMEKNKSL